MRQVQWRWPEPSKNLEFCLSAKILKKMDMTGPEALARR